MSTKNRLSKTRLLQASFVGAVALFSAHCARVTDRPAEEKAVLASSTFYPGEVAAGMMSTGTDGGTIPAPGSGGSGGDGGSIPAPGSGGSGGTDGGSSGGDTAGGDTGGSSGGDTAGGDTGGSSGGDTAGGNTGGGAPGGDDVADNGGTDGGTIPGGDTGGGTPGDGGTIGGGDTGGTDGGSSGGDTAGGDTGGSSGGDTAGGDTGGTPGDGDVADNGGNDGGTIPGGDGSSGGNDGGSVPGGGDTGGTDGGSSGGDTAGGDTGGDSGGDTAGGDNGGGTPGDGDVADNGGNDGGTIPGGDDGDGDDDGGSVPGGEDCTSAARGRAGRDGKVAVCHIPPGNPSNAHTIRVGQPAVRAHLAHGDALGDCSCQSDPGGGKVALCHIPPGHPENAHTIEVGESAVAAHLAHGDIRGACPAEQHELVDILLNRVCSVRRSGTRALFFEEAARPILSFEATPPEPALRQQMAKNPRNKRGIRWFAGFFSRRASYASAGFFSARPTVAEPGLLQKIDLGHVDLRKGPFRGQVDLNFTVLQARYPSDWGNALIEASVCDDTDGDGLCRDEDANYTLSMKKLAFLAKHVPTNLSFDVWSGRNKTLGRDPAYCEKQYSPIVLDLKGNGVQLTPAEEGVAFDLNDTGSPVYSGWVSGTDDAFLVRDLNGNGQIDSGAELFGSATRLLNGRRAPNGFEALKELDEDADGLITGRDSVYRTAKLWLDRNYSGTVERGELLELSRVGVLSLNLDYVDVLEVDPHGNETRQRSTFTRRVRGHAYPFLMVDIWFRTLMNW